MNRRLVNKKLVLGAAWSQPIVSFVSLPVHAQTSSGPQGAVIGRWKASRIDGGTPIFAAATKPGYEIEFFEDGAYQIGSQRRGPNLWSVDSDGKFYFCIFSIKCLFGKVVAYENGIAQKIIIDRGYTFVSDVQFERIKK